MKLIDSENLRTKAQPFGILHNLPYDLPTSTCLLKSFALSACPSSRAPHVDAASASGKFCEFCLHFTQASENFNPEARLGFIGLAEDSLGL